MSIITGTPEDRDPEDPARARVPAPPGASSSGTATARWTTTMPRAASVLMGEEVIPATREMAKEFDLKGPFEMGHQHQRAHGAGRGRRRRRLLTLLPPSTPEAPAILCGGFFVPVGAPLPPRCATISAWTSDSGLDADVLVVGGGPAGSAAATMLARKGWTVRIYERDRFPREHVGESLLPASMPVLAELGVLPAVEAAGFLPKYGATMVWGSDPDPWSWSFRESQSPATPTPSRSFAPSSTKSSSATPPPRASTCARVTVCLLRMPAPPAQPSASRTAMAREHTASARFVVDASGQGGALIGRARGLREADPFFRNLAVYGYYAGGSRLPEPDANNIFIESIEDGWLWAIPLHTGLLSTGVVVDSAVGRERINELGPEAFFRERVASGPHTAALLGGATLTAAPTVVPRLVLCLQRARRGGFRPRRRRRLLCRPALLIGCAPRPLLRRARCRLRHHRPQGSRTRTRQRRCLLRAVPAAVPALP